MSYEIITIPKFSTDVVGASEVQTIELNDIGAADTYTLTFNGTTTGTITYAADSSADIQAKLEALASIAPGDISVTQTDDDTYPVTFLSTGAYAGQNAPAITITSPSGFTPTGVTETTSGRSEKTKTVHVPGKWCQLLAVRWGLFVDGASNELLITDAGGRTAYSVTGKDTNVSGALLSTHIGQDGQDQSGNAAANVAPGVFEGPLTVRVRNGAGTVSPASGIVQLYLKVGGQRSAFLERSTGTIQVSAAGAKTVTLRTGPPVVSPKRIRISGFDTSTDFAITDADGRNVFTDTAINGSASAFDTALGYDGEDQAGNAAADLLPGVFRGPFTVAVTNGGTSTTGSIKIIEEV